MPIDPDSDSDSDSLVLQEEEEEDDDDDNDNDDDDDVHHQLPPPIPNRNFSSASEPIQRMRRRSNINLRKSMAWNNAFFTEQGVLNPQELSRLNGSSSKFSKEFLWGIPEEEAKSLLDDSVSSRSITQHSEGTLFRESPLRPVSSDPKVITLLSPKLDTARENTSLGSKTAFDMYALGKTSQELNLVKGGNKSLLKAEGCPRTLGSASQKKLLSMDLRNPQMKDLKIPRFAVSKLEYPSVSAAPKASALGAKHSNSIRIRQEGNLEKNISPKGFSSISRTTFSCVLSTARPSTLSSGKDMACEATAGLKVISDRLPTSDANTSKAAIPLPQKATSGKLTSAQICPTKPSGLRMPSPSLRYFSQPHAPVSHGVKSPRDAPTCNFCKDSNPVPRTFGDTYHTGKRRSLHKPAGTVKLSELGLNAKKSLTPAATTTPHPSIKLNTEVKQSVGEILQDSSLGISKREVCGVGWAEILIQDQDGEKAHQLSESTILSDVDSKKTVRSHFDISDCELCFESKNTVQGGYIKEFQIDGLLGNIHDLPSEDEDFSASDLETAYNLPLVNTWLQNYGVSGADCLKSSIVDNGGRKSLVHNDLLQASIGIDTLSEVQKEHTVLGEVQNAPHEESHIPLIKSGGLIEQGSTSEQSLEDSDIINLTRSRSKNGVSSNYTETTDLYGPLVSCGKKWKFDNTDVTAEDKDSIIQKKRKSSFDSRHEALTLKHKLNAAPFSDEWLAALEEAGEEILTMKTGAVQNSPPDKSLPQPGPWSPVKRKNIPELGPFDCTKYTNLPLPEME